MLNVRRAARLCGPGGGLLIGIDDDQWLVGGPLHTGPRSR
jgi:hypothetical protein